MGKLFGGLVFVALALAAFGLVQSATPRATLPTAAAAQFTPFATVSPTAAPYTAGPDAYATGQAAQATGLAYAAQATQAAGQVYAVTARAQETSNAYLTTRQAGLDAVEATRIQVALQATAGAAGVLATAEAHRAAVEAQVLQGAASGTATAEALALEALERRYQDEEAARESEALFWTNARNLVLILAFLGAAVAFGCAWYWWKARVDADRDRARMVTADEGRIVMYALPGGGAAVAINGEWRRIEDVIDQPPQLALPAPKEEPYTGQTVTATVRGQSYQVPLGLTPEEQARVDLVADLLRSAIAAEAVNRKDGTRGPGGQSEVIPRYDALGMKSDRAGAAVDLLVAAGLVVKGKGGRPPKGGVTDATRIVSQDYPTLAKLLRAVERGLVSLTPPLPSAGAPQNTP